MGLRGIGFGAEQIGIAALRFPRIASVCIFVLLVLIGSSLPNLSFDDDINRVFLSDSALSQAQQTYEAEQSPPLGTVLIHVTSPAALSADQMTSLRDLSLDLEFIEGVTAVASPFVLRWPPTADAPSGTPLFGQQIDKGFIDDLAAFEALDTGLPTFLNTTLTAMMFSVSINTDQTTVAAAVSNISAELGHALPAGLSANITGEDVISSEIVSGLKDDLIALNLWGAVMVALAAFVLLRDLRMALLAVFPAVTGAAGVLALSVWLGYPITVLSNVIPILLLVLGVADGVHLAGSIKETGDVRRAIETIGPACALTALTTAVAFASITLTGNSQLYEFAVLGAVGTMLSFAIVIVTFAVLGRTFRLSDRAVPQISASIAQRLTKIGVARPRTTVVLCILVLILATFGFSQTRAWFPLYLNLPDGSATLGTNDAISEDFGGVFQMIVETDGDWKQTRALTERLEAASGPGTVLSEVNFARWLGHPDTRPSQEELATLPRELVDQIRAKEDSSRIFVSVPEPMRSKDTLAQFDEIHYVALAAGADRVIGLPTIMRVEAVTLIGQLSFGLLVAAVGATGLVAVAFRSVRLVPVLIIPNVLPLMLTGASLHLWAQGQLTPTAVLALTIAFGIAIDDTVHFLSRFRALTAQGQTAQQAVLAAAGSTGQVMVLTTLLLTFGLCVTLFSDFNPIRVFGGMMIVTLWAALLTDLFLLPALLTWKRTANGSV
ncbi:RND family transporter [Oceaniovalibus sp. ACAM 378]|uniref:efflux RND transporter permease subunit n=1 Tax=Oceaniovalibus sp. ACAM 378 TaxID=2599923 RepID=UPI002106125E|nr:MMPL family transporter [Oceaniovalibus sp. ACAM 378]